MSSGPITRIDLLQSRIEALESANAELQAVNSELTELLEATSDQRFRKLARSVDLFLFISKRELEWSYVNPRFLEYTGFEKRQALGQGWLAAVHPADVAAIRERWSAGQQGTFEMEFRIRGREGDYRWFLCRAVPTIGASGRVRWYGACTDIHATHEGEERLRFLMGELQHRVKNILSVVRSIFMRTVETSRSQDDLVTHFNGRLDALARTQRTLVRTPVRGVDLEEVVSAELLSHGAPHEALFAMSGPQVCLRATAAEAFGLLVHELATNAAKYGALAVSGGRISVNWRIEEMGEGGRLVWEWSESGVPVLDSRPMRAGFGRELIEQGIPYELGGRSSLAFRPGGICCTIELPLSDSVTVDLDADDHREENRKAARQ